MENKRQHFVSQHYLRQFSVAGSDTIVITTLDPYRSVGVGSIKGQCQDDNFYGKESKLDKMLQGIEGLVAPALVGVAKNRVWNKDELMALRLLAVQLHLRTRKASESAKQFPRLIADKVIRNGISLGKLPEPPAGWKAEMMDFGGVPQLLLAQTRACFLETTTLGFKLLSALPPSFFITSDHPAIVLNQFAAGAGGTRSHVGFSQAGFQLLLPIAPQLCAFFFDQGVYKVGGRRDLCVDLSAADVDIVNALQLQSADKCIYSHDPSTEGQIKALVVRHGRLRMPLTDSVRTYPAGNAGEMLIHVREPVLKFPAPWSFCRHRRHISKNVGERRDSGWTAMIEAVDEDIEKNPDSEDLSKRVERIYGRV